MEPMESMGLWEFLLVPVSLGQNMLLLKGLFPLSPLCSCDVGSIVLNMWMLISMLEWNLEHRVRIAATSALGVDACSVALALAAHSILSSLCESSLRMLQD